MLTVALCNQKGGVGKTTTTVNLARAAKLRGLRTLVVDLDPQSNTTSTLLGAVSDDTVSVADLLSPRGEVTFKQVVRATGWDGVDVLPAGGDILASVGAELVALTVGREYRLREALDGASYDLVLLDCPPALDLLTINGLVAAELALIVTSATLWSTGGVARLMRTLDAIRTYNNPRLRACGTVVNNLENNRRQKHWFAQLDSHAPAPVWTPPIPHLTVMGEAIEAGQGLDEVGTVQAAVIAESYDEYLHRLLQAAGLPLPDLVPQQAPRPARRAVPAGAQ